MELLALGMIRGGGIKVVRQNFAGNRKTLRNRGSQVLQGRDIDVADPKQMNGIHSIQIHSTRIRSNQIHPASVIEIGPIPAAPLMAACAAFCGRLRL
jgi:hypothetical protein